MWTREPIAIVGMGCRLPGAEGTAAFLTLLEENRDAIENVPSSRWDASAIYHPDRTIPGHTYATRGGFLRDVDCFDARFFGISPREAASMDPQTRLMMEVASETFDDAGFNRARYAERTGVYIGISGSDYQDILLSERESIDGYMATGTALCIAANRISHAFDLHGPSMAVDTACSSSLVAVHLACSALWGGECDAALAGGVCLLLRPEVTLGFGKGFMLSEQAQCRAFDSRGDGFVRGEGSGVVLLKRVSDALRDGDSIRAVILGTGVNQDGHTPTGIAVPNVEAQKALLVQTYANAGVNPHDVHFVEAHGPGTPVGDPIEAEALGTVLGAGRARGNDLVLGSVKTNIGHLEPAAGIAGLLKASLSLQHERVFANLHFETPNPAIAFDDLHLRVARTNEPWSGSESRPRIAGVNSFGFGGTNAHVVLAGAEWITGTVDPAKATQDEPSTANRNPKALLLSARSDAALRASAESMAQWLDVGAPTGFANVCHSAAVRREHHGERLAIVASSAEEAAGDLRAFLRGEKHPSVFVGTAKSAPLGFVFCGMGSHWWGMGQELFSTEPAFRAIVEECDAHMRPWVGWSLVDELRRDEAGSRLGRFDFAQPAMFAVQCGLSAMWRTFGVEPDVIVGHSVGEGAAAYAAGVLSLEDAARVVVERSKLQVTTQGKGRLLAVGLAESEIAAYLAGREAAVSVAAVNGPSTVTLAGDASALESIARALEPSGAFVKFLRADVPAHSPAMKPLCGPLAESLRGLQPRRATTRLFSTVTGAVVDGEELDARYWAANLRRPVRFADAIGRMIGEGTTRFLEIAPHPVLAASINECAAAAKQRVTSYASIRRKEPESRAVCETLAALHVAGKSVAWGKVLVGSLVPLPPYPWQRERHWKEPESARASRLPRRGPPLLGMEVPGPQPAWELAVHRHGLPAMYDHCVQGEVIWPAAGYVEMAIEAIRDAHPSAAIVLQEIALERAMVMPRDGVVVARFTRDEGSFSVASRHAQTSTWERNASGRFELGTVGGSSAKLDVCATRARCERLLPHEDVYAKLTRMGDAFGPAFCTVQYAHLGQGECLAKLESPGLGVSGTVVDPVLLDGCFQALVMNLDRHAEGSALPVLVRELRVLGSLSAAAWAHARLTRLDDAGFSGDITIADDDGKVVLEVVGFEFKSLELAARSCSRPRVASPLHVTRWELSDPRSAPSAISHQSFAFTDDSLRDISRDVTTRCDRDRHYDVARPALDALAMTYVAEAIVALGFRFAAGERATRRDLHERLGIVPAQKRAFERAISELVGSGILMEESGTLSVGKAPMQSADEMANVLIASLPGYAPELAIVRRCGQGLAAVWRGPDDPLSLLFPEGETMGLEHLYSTGATAQVYNAILSEALHRLARSGGRRLRVLEVGAGTGGTTVHLLESLRGLVHEYVFTDISPLFLRRAEKRFGSDSRVSFRALDLDRDPLEQGFANGSFDIIVAVDAVHATRDVRQTVRRLDALLRPGGYLALVELTRPPFWTEVTFGLLPGWWAFEDTELRPYSALLPAHEWERVLQEEGLEVASWGDRPDGEQRVLLARAGHAAASPLGLDTSGSWVVIGDREGVGGGLVDRLRTNGAEAWQADAPSVAGSGDGALGALVAALRPRGVVLCSTFAFDETGEAAVSLTEAGVALAKTLMEANFEGRLFLVTRHAQAVDGRETVNPVGAALWGLGRVIANEHPEWQTRIIDVAGGDDSESLAHELMRKDGEDEVALRDDGRWVRRWRRAAPEGLEAAVPESGASRLKPGQVRLAVEAIGAPGPVLSLWEVVGRVEEVADGVSLDVGARVATVLSEMPCSTRPFSLVLDARLLTAVPRGLGARDAAAGTAALSWMQEWIQEAGLVTGEVLWIHGPVHDAIVGASVRIARSLGIHVVVSAPHGMDGLDTSGLSCPVLDGRSIRLIDEIRAAVGGRTVDVAMLLASPGPLFDLGRCLVGGGLVAFAPGALEGLPMLFTRGATLAPLDFGSGPSLGSFAAVLDDVARGALDVLPYRGLVGVDARDHRAALTTAVKVVLDRVPTASPPHASLVRADATYLLIGGLGGLGLRLARHLVEQGARRLILVGRKGAQGAATLGVLAELRGLGAEVIVAAADATVNAELAAVLAVARGDAARPLRGAVHAAMVLEDSTVTKIDRRLIARVLGPKVDVALALDRMTADDPLDFFALFSSFASIVGNPGQGAYAAANAVLDALAHARRSRGRPAVSVNWGSISNVGYVAERAEVEAHLRQRGITPILAEEAMGLYDIVLSSREPQVAVIDVDWSRWCAAHAAGPAPRFSSLRAAKSLGSSSAEGEAGKVLSTLEAIRNEAARSLRMVPSQLDVDVPLLSLGFDSLMAVELRTMLHHELGADVSTMKIMRGPSVRELADDVDRRSARESGLTFTPSSPAAGPRPAERALVCSVPRPGALHRLFCIPYNGGGIASYHAWNSLTPASIEVHSARLAGQMDRREEPAPTALLDWATELADAIAPLLDRPYALYGHSLGALVAFEVGRALRARGLPEPAVLFVGAIHAPHLPDPFPSSDRLTDVPTLERLGMLDALTPLLADPELVAELRPTIQSGVDRLKRYCFAEETPLGCPIVAMGGSRDGVIGRAHLDAWRVHSSVGFERLTFEGGHLFHQERADDVVATIVSRLEGIEFNRRVA